MSKHEKPRYVLPYGWNINLHNKIGFDQLETPVGTVFTFSGETMQICTDTVHEQLIYQRSDGQIQRRPSRARMSFFHDQQPVQPIDGSGEVVGDFSRKPKIDIEAKWRAAGGYLKSTPKNPSSFKLKP